MEIMLNHTTGPWNVSEAVEEIHDDYYSIANLAEMEIVAYVGDGSSGYSPQRESNARLIAAAPDLLAALRATLALLTDPDAESADRVTDTVREAIARAEGE
jgi:hypothetical protein